MSPHFPVCTAKEVGRVLRDHGFVLRSQRGVIKNGFTLTAVSRSFPGRKPIAIETLKSIIDAAGLTVEDFR